MKSGNFMMDALGGSQGFPERMNLFYSSSFKHPDIELKKSSDFMEYSANNSSLLTRYRSAPSSFLEGLKNGAAAGYDDFQYDRTSTLEIDNFVAKYMLGTNGSMQGGFGDSKCVKREEEEPVPVTQFGGGYSNPRNSFGGVCSMGTESSIQPEMNRNGSGIAMHCSSPADLFSRSISSETGNSLEFAAY